LSRLLKENLSSLTFLLRDNHGTTLLLLKSGIMRLLNLYKVKVKDLLNDKHDDALP
jgi:hypothetical protein